MTDRRDDEKALLLQEPEKMAQRASEDVCCFGMVSCMVVETLVVRLDTSPLQLANHLLKHLSH